VRHAPIAHVSLFLIWEMCALIRRSQIACARPAGCIFVATGTGVCWRKEHPVENILFIIFFVELGKREMCLYIARLPLPEIRDAPP
jgi:hypothetical protein